jgi:hypothetical protein
VEFTVHTPGETEHRNHGEAYFKVLGSSVLHVCPRDERDQEQVV